VQNGTVLPFLYPHHIKMEKKNLTEDQVFSVCCPTCGVSVGEPCIWNSGGLSLGPHLNREMSALKLIERGKPNDNLMTTGSSNAPVQSAPRRTILMRKADI
jgi:hypothetical protein